ncbi:MAG: hypothetical protein IPM13_10200 [Phycisphaerales bacterium]|nr:hypothetical protein [Phycisphaerales bacterium]
MTALTEQVYYQDAMLREPSSVTHADERVDSYDYAMGIYSSYAFTVNPQGAYRRVTIEHLGPNGTALEFLSTRDTTVTDSGGRVVLREQAVWIPPGHWATTSRAATTYDAKGRPVQVSRLDPADNSVIGLTTTVWGDCCNKRTVTDESGIVTTHIADRLGRPTRTIRWGVEGCDSQSIVARATDVDYASVEYGGIGAFEQVTVTEGPLPGVYGYAAHSETAEIDPLAA